MSSPQADDNREQPGEQAAGQPEETASLDETPVSGSPEEEAPAQAPTVQESEQPAPRTQRLVSLDAFRGLTIIGMLLVNNAAMDTATPKHFTHAPWNAGLHFADLVFPWFLLIVGVATPYAMASHRKKGYSGWNFVYKAASRAVILVLLGCLIDSAISRTPVFDLGVLQIIGLAYFVGAVLAPLPTLERGILAAMFLVGHWALLRFVAVPGHAPGQLTEEVNLINHINRTYLQQYHLSGLLSVIPTAAMVLIGTIVGDQLRRTALAGWKKAAWLAAIGGALAVAGWLWSLDIPFNKPLWTASYIVFTAGLGVLTLAAFYLLIDVTGWKVWSFPLVVFGMNAIAAYVIPIIVKVQVLQQWTWHLPNGSNMVLQTALLQSCIHFTNRVIGGWMYTIGYILFWWLVMLYMYKKRVFLRV